jgi:uncharacterized protein YutE (UPF0331/DUF86 family)
VIDADLVIRKMVLITGDLDTLRRMAQKSRAEFLASDIDELAAERCLERAIGRMIDINYHLITESGHPPPADYHASFTYLTKLGILSRDFAEQIASCAGLRNRIAHEYDDIDPRMVYEALRTALRDIPLYLQGVRDYLNRTTA